jgi:hypothetical protein
MVVALCLVTTMTLASAVGKVSSSGVSYGRPADCAVTKVCLYDNTNFLAFLTSFAASNQNWDHQNAAVNKDTSAYNAGSPNWDVRVFSGRNWGGGFYCLKPGRGWINLGAFAGGNNNAESNRWTQNVCT